MVAETFLIRLENYISKSQFIPSFAPQNHLKILPMWVVANTP